MPQTRLSTIRLTALVGCLFLVITAFSLVPKLAKAQELFDIQRVTTPRMLLLYAERHRQVIERAIAVRKLREALEGNGSEPADPLAYADVTDGSASPGGPFDWYASTNNGQPAPLDQSNSRWYGFASGSYSHVDSDVTTAKFEGPAYGASVGVDYQLTQDIIVGLLVGYDSSDLDTQFLAGGAGFTETEGIGLGPYVNIALGDYFRLGGSFFYAWRTTDLGDTIATASYDSELWTANASLTGSFGTDWTTLLPTVGVSYSSTQDDAYSDSNGFPFPSQTVEVGTLNFGASVSQVIVDAINWSATAWVSAMGIWEFEIKSPPPGVASNSVNQDDLNATISGGIDFMVSSNVDLSLSGSVGSLGIDDYTTYSIAGAVGIAF